MRVMPDLWHQHLSHADSIYEKTIAACDGHDVNGCTAIVYVLFSHSAHYLGKANLRRKQYDSGFAQRVLEHSRGLMLPTRSEGWRPRYKVIWCLWARAA